MTEQYRNLLNNLEVGDLEVFFGTSMVKEWGKEEGGWYEGVGGE